MNNFYETTYFNKEKQNVFFVLDTNTHEVKCVYEGVDIPESEWNEKQWQLYYCFRKLSIEKGLLDYKCQLQMPQIMSDFVREVKKNEVKKENKR